jgi:hypothetical protein
VSLDGYDAGAGVANTSLDNCDARKRGEAGVSRTSLDVCDAVVKVVQRRI